MRRWSLRYRYCPPKKRSYSNGQSYRVDVESEAY
jgi:hypothetical protein